MQIAYGATETSPVVNLTLRDDPDSKRYHTVGTSLPFTEVKILLIILYSAHRIVICLII